VRARLTSLLRGELVLDRIALEQPSIHLRRDADGRGNWEGLLRGSSGSGPGTQIAGLEVRGGSLDFSDAASALEFRISDWNVDMGAWRAAAPVSLRTRFTLHHASLPAAGVPVALEIPDLTAVPAPLSISAPTFAVRVADARAEGAVAFRQDANGTSAAGPLTLRIPSVRQLLTNLGIEISAPRDRETLGAAQLSGHWSMRNGAMQIRPLALQVDQTRLTGWLERTATAGAQGIWAFELHGGSLNLDRYLQSDQPRRRPLELPIQWLKGLPVRGSLTLEEAQIGGAQLKQAQLRVEP
jgi:hypothetical protein